MDEAQGSESHPEMTRPKHSFITTAACSRLYHGTKRNDSSSICRNIRLRPGVLLCTQNDRRSVIFDENRGRFFALDEIGTRLLQRSMQSNPDQAIRAVAKLFHVSPDLVSEDWQTLWRKLQHEKLIAQDHVCITSRKVPSTCKLFILLTWAWISLRLFGWSRSIRFWRSKCCRQFSGSINQANDLILAVDRAVTEAAAQHWLNTECKERSLVAWLILTRDIGVPAELIIGVNFYPFHAHAWVESNSLTVTDHAVICETYTPIARYK